MTVFVVPTSTSLSSYTERVQLDGRVYELRFRWNIRMGSWFLDVVDELGEFLVAGRRCVADGLLFRQSHHIEGVPLGELMAFDTTNRQTDPQLNDFGSRVVLLYADAETITEAS